MSHTHGRSHFAAYIHGDNALLHGRTTRAFAQAGGVVRDGLFDIRALAEALRGADEVMAIAEEGTWFPSTRIVPELAAVGMWVAIGVRVGEHADALVWKRLLAPLWG